VISPMTPLLARPATTGRARAGLPMPLPRAHAAIIPAVTRSLISEDSSSGVISADLSTIPWTWRTSLRH
jgi:hypothetical protein